MESASAARLPAPPHRSGNDPLTVEAGDARGIESTGTWLAGIAEAAVGQRLGERGSLEPVPLDPLNRLRQPRSGLRPTNECADWLDWFLDDRSTRKISPRSTITVPDYVASLLERENLDAAREAVLLAPTNAAALTHLSKMLLRSADSDSRLNRAEAAFLQRRADALAVNQPVVQDMP
jgi:hypothetical protein